MSKTVYCVKLDREAEALDRPPMPGSLGQKIFERISREAWGQWIRFQTMLINEHRLNLADPEAREYLKGEMIQYLFDGHVD